MRCAVLLALVAGCYSPRAPDGAPCEIARDCPSLQRCLLGRCSSRAAVVDAAVVDAPDDIDAPAIDARPDAMPLPCTTVGLSCGGQAVAFTCGTRCWVRCPSGATWTAASQACTGWQGALGQIDDALEQSCVAMRVSTATWIGLRQSDMAASPAQDWYWNTSANPVVYTRWQSGTPDDQDDNENRDEQCGKMQSDGTWDDVGCGATTGFLCERN